MATVGSAALVAALVTDRVARSGIGSSASLVNTWVSFHALAFGDASVVVALRLITVVILQAIGALYECAVNVQCELRIVK